MISNRVIVVTIFVALFVLLAASNVLFGTKQLNALGNTETKTIQNSTTRNLVSR